MSTYVIGPVASTSTYPADGDVPDWIGTHRIIITVFNAAIYLQMEPDGLENVNYPWEPESFYAPGWYSLNRLVRRVRFRSAVATLPALVTVEGIRVY